MDFDRFTGEVQHRARLSDTDAALAATRATLTTLAERLDEGAARNIAAQLPGEIARLLEEGGSATSFELQDFYDKVAEREPADFPAAVHHARSVLSVVDEATNGMLAKEQAQLGPEFAPLMSDVAEFSATYSQRRS